MGGHFGSNFCGRRPLSDIMGHAETFLSGEGEAKRLKTSWATEAFSFEFVTRVCGTPITHRDIVNFTTKPALLEGNFTTHCV